MFRSSLWPHLFFLWVRRWMGFDLFLALIWASFEVISLHRWPSWVHFSELLVQLWPAATALSLADLGLDLHRSQFWTAAMSLGWSPLSLGSALIIPLVCFSSMGSLLNAKYFAKAHGSRSRQTLNESQAQRVIQNIVPVQRQAQWIQALTEPPPPKLKELMAMGWTALENVPRGFKERMRRVIDPWLGILWGGIAIRVGLRGRNMPSKAMSLLLAISTFTIGHTLWLFVWMIVPL